MPASALPWAALPSFLEEAERFDEILPNGEICEAILAAVMAIVCGRLTLLT